MKERLLEFLKIENKSSAQFAEEIGVQPSSISHIISGRNNPSLDFVVKMLNKYPALSTDWLLFGKGNMYRESDLSSIFDAQPTDNDKYKARTTENITERVVSEKEKNVFTGSGNLKEVISVPKSNRPRRIICFFEDQTFQEYLPGD